MKLISNYSKTHFFERHLFSYGITSYAEIWSIAFWGGAKTQ